MGGDEEHRENLRPCRILSELSSNIKEDSPACFSLERSDFLMFQGCEINQKYIHLQPFVFCYVLNLVCGHVEGKKSTPPIFCSGSLLDEGLKQQ